MITVKAESRTRGSARQPSHVAYAVPGAALILLVIIVAIYIAYISIQPHAAGEGSPSVTFDNWLNVFAAASTRRAIILTVWMSLAVAAICIVVSFMVALFARYVGSARLNGLITFAMLVPLLTNLVIQIVGWLDLFSPSGPIAAATGVSLAFTDMGVLIVLVQYLLPFSYFTIDSSMRGIPRTLDEAVHVLGGGSARSVFGVIVPLCRRGMVSGGLLVFALAFGSFIVPVLVGGYKVPFIAVLVRGAIERGNWPTSAAIATLLTVVALLIVFATEASTKERRQRGRGANRTGGRA